jgi:hypothetical protein
VAGDAFFKEIGIQPGGVIEGSLMPRSAVESASSGLPVTRQSHDIVAANRYSLRLADTAPVSAKSGAGWRAWRYFAVAALLLAVVAAGVLLGRDPVVVTPPVAAVPSATAAVPSVAAPVAAEALDAAPLPLQKVMVIRGDDPAKPAGVFFVTSNEPALLFKKQRQDPGEGTRIEIRQGAIETVAISKDELFRVGKGRGLSIFYQGRKVAPQTISNGTWMSFVPHGS